jgi:hypothetical protein
MAFDQLQVGANLRIGRKATLQRTLIALKRRVRESAHLAAPIGRLHRGMRPIPDGDVGKPYQCGNQQGRQ